MLEDQAEAVADGFSSMSQDVMNCRKTEMDAINGFMVERTATHNVPTPYNLLFRDLIHATEGTSTQYWPSTPTSESASAA